MRHLLISLLVLAAITGLPQTRSLAAERSQTEQAAEMLQKSVVTVRVVLPMTSEPADKDELSASPPRKPHVTVCSGVVLDGGLVVSSVFATTDSVIRVTLPGGEQAEAKLRVMDEFSGLVLLQLDKESVPGLAIAEEPPAAGASVMSAAAWGTDQPVVSRGIVGGTGRILQGASYPPLLQCDLRTVETSGGGPIVNLEGELLGVIILTGQTGAAANGWTYAVPVEHVRRLLRARTTNPAESSLAVLKRRRPEVGMVLDGDAEGVFVSRITPGGPADQAGIRVGDQVLATDDVQIRSVYQAVRPFLFKQPGDIVTLLVQQQDALRKVEVTLGGGVELPAASLKDLSKLVQPKIEVEGLAQGIYRSRTADGRIREVFAPDPAELNISDMERMTGDEKIELLEKALDRYRSAIVYLRRQIADQEAERHRTEQLIKSLQSEVEALQRQAADAAKLRDDVAPSP